MNHRQYPTVRTGKCPRVHQQAEEHDVHGQKTAHAETYQKPRRLRRIATAALHLVGDAAAKTTELAALTVHGTGEAAPADRQQAVAAQSVRPCPPAVFQ